MPATRTYCHGSPPHFNQRITELVASVCPDPSRVSSWRSTTPSDLQAMVGQGLYCPKSSCFHLVDLRIQFHTRNSTGSPPAEKILQATAGMEERGSHGKQPDRLIRAVGSNDSALSGTSRKAPKEMAQPQLDHRIPPGTRPGGILSESLPPLEVDAPAKL